MPEPAPSCRSTMHEWTTSVPCRCVCVFFEHVLVGFSSIEHVDAAHQNLAQGPCSIDGRGNVVLPLVVTRLSRRLCFASQEADASVSEAARQRKTAAVTVVVVQNLCSLCCQSNSTKNQTAQEAVKCLQTFAPPDQKPVIIHRENSLWYFSVLVKTSAGITTSHHQNRSETNGIAESLVRGI